MWCVPRGVQSFTCLPTVCPPVEGSAPPTLLTAMETNYAEAVARGGEAGLSHCHWSVTLSLVCHTVTGPTSVCEGRVLQSVLDVTRGRQADHRGAPAARLATI